MHFGKKLIDQLVETEAVAFWTESFSRSHNTMLLQYFDAVGWVF